MVECWWWTEESEPEKQSCCVVRWYGRILLQSEAGWVLSWSIRGISLSRGPDSNQQPTFCNCAGCNKPPKHQVVLVSCQYPKHENRKWWNGVQPIDYQRKTKLTQYWLSISLTCLWNTVVGSTGKIIMAELMVEMSALGLVIWRRRHFCLSGLFTAPIH